MTNRDVRRPMAVVIAALYLSACSHSPSSADIPPGASFTTKILADDTKLFVYSQRFARGGRDNPAGDDDLHEEKGRGAGFFGGGPGRGAQFAKAALQGVQAMLAQNHYCRDGYVILEQYDERASYIIRGECRDAATSAERSKFSQ